MQLSDCDAYVNIAGGIRMNEPAIDLGIVLAIISSKLDLTIDEKTICFGEVGLSGEVRGVTMAEQRVAEAAKLGFKRCILPSVCLGAAKGVKGIELVGVSNVREALEAIQ
jgi:DNA repair protein RadA/Sms